jgi:hypothetical protein
MKNSSDLPTYEDGTVCSETFARKIQTLGNHPEKKKVYNFSLSTAPAGGRWLHCA